MKKSRTKPNNNTIATASATIIYATHTQIYKYVFKYAPLLSSPVYLNLKLSENKRTAVKVLVVVVVLLK